jgi:pyruvate/2-oxoglutarate/acetoin dehydrogenase E1 component
MSRHAVAREITGREAIVEALREEMERDENVFLIGEDLRHWGGICKGLQPLWKQFGDERVIDTAISESAIVGASVGAAMMGFKPVCEIYFADLLPLAMDHIVNSAAKIRYQTGGKVGVPLVIRSQYGAVGRQGLHNSQNLEAWFMHVPGLKVVMPSNPYDAKGLLKAAVRDPDPVLFLEHKLFYGLKGWVPEEEYIIPIGKGDVKREGSDVTVVTYGHMVGKAIAAAEELERTGISVEVMDLRTSLPLDKDMILDSVKKTRRLVIVHEACRSGGAGAEIAAVVSGEGFWFLDAPIRRVAAADVPIPFSEVLEAYVLPGEEDIIEAVKNLFA